jgi:hypothetical protein
MAGSGHEDAFLQPRLSARYRFSQRTSAGTRGNGRDAPKPVIERNAIRRLMTRQEAEFPADLLMEKIYH